MVKQKAIGIDLGTTYSCVGVVIDGQVEIIESEDSDAYTVPSCVAFTEKGVLVGEKAKYCKNVPAENIIINAKRLIGRKYDDPKLQAATRHLPFRVENKDGNPIITIGEGQKQQRYSPEEISAKVLRKMKEMAEDRLGQTVYEAVITVPAHFNNAQKRATKQAAEMADLHVLQLLHEPTAAAIAYGLQEKRKKKRNVLVFDLGGGTFDISILTIEDECFTVKTTAGDPYLGGEDFDSRMATKFAAEFSRDKNVDMREDKGAMRKLLRECEKAKRLLSEEGLTRTRVVVESLHAGHDFSGTISRSQFENLNEDYFESTEESIEFALDDADITKDEVDEIVLAGGSTRIPYVQTMLREYFGKELCTSINPDEAVAYGAAYRAALLAGDTSPQLRQIKVIDVIPLSLGIETYGGVMSVIIPRNTEYPTRKQNNYTTVDDYQTSVKLSIFEGDRSKTKMNFLMGSTCLEGLRPAHAGVPSIEVSFEIDLNGMLHMNACEYGTSIEQTMSLDWGGRGRKEEDISIMIKQAEENHMDDKEWKRNQLAMNNLRQYANKMKRLVNSSRITNNVSSQENARLRLECESTVNWIQENKNASAQESGEKQNHLEEVFRPFRRWTLEEEKY